MLLSIFKLLFHVSIRLEEIYLRTARFNTFTLNLCLHNLDELYFNFEALLSCVSAQKIIFSFLVLTVYKEDTKNKYFSQLGNTRGGRPTTSISSPNHILIIFSSEPHQNPRPFNIIFISISIYILNYFRVPKILY